MLTRASSTGGAHKLELGGCMLLWNSLHRYQFSKLPALSQVPRIVNPPADVFKRYFVAQARSEEHTSELQSLMRISYAVFCLKKKLNTHHHALLPNTNDKTK